MPTKRRKLAAHRVGLSPAALQAWVQGDKVTLHRECGLRPWQLSPFDAGPNRDDEIEMPGYHESWPRARELRQALIAAAGEPGRVGRHGRPYGHEPDEVD